MKNCLKIALDYKKKNMLPTDVDEEVLLDDMTNGEAIELWLNLIAIYGCKDIRKCVKFYKGRYISLDFTDLFEYAVDGVDFDISELQERLNSLIDSEEFKEILRSPLFITAT